MARNLAGGGHALGTACRSLVHRPLQGPQPPNPGARTTRPSPTSSPSRRKALNARNRPAPIPRPNVLRTGIPRTLRDGFQRKGRSPSFGRRRGLGAESKRPQNFSWGLSRGILSIRKESPLTGSGPSPARRAARRAGGFPASQMGRGLPDLHQKPKTLYFI